jgi:hypothetical protein
MTHRRLLLPLACAAAALAAGAQAAEYVTIVQELEIARPAEAVWKKVGGYCDLGTWMKTTCVYTSGTGEVGTMRRIADRIDEVMVSSTPLSYTYAQPGQANFYHGSMEVRPLGAAKSKIVYTLFYDVAALPTPEAKAQDKARRAAMFKTALDTMKTLSEAP